MTQWVVWAHACLVLAAYHAWGWTGGPPGPRWWRGRRWTVRSVIRALRTERWRLGDEGFWAGWPAMPADAPERGPPVPPLVACATHASRL